MLLKLKSYIKPHILLVWDLNTLGLSALENSVRQNLNREIRELRDVIIQIVLTNIYRTFHTNIKEYNFFSASHGTFSKVDYILANKTNLNRPPKIGITPYILSDHHDLKLD